MPQNVTTKLRGVLLSSMAFLLLAGMTGAAYASDNRSIEQQCEQGRLDLQIKDQNEPWKDGVYGTWVASNMAPGERSGLRRFLCGPAERRKGKDISDV